METRGQPQQKDKVGMKTGAEREAEEEPAKKHGAGTRLQRQGEGKSLSTKVAQLLPLSHCIFSFLSFRWTLFRLNSHSGVISERNMQLFLTQNKSTFLARLLNFIDFSMKG